MKVDIKNEIKFLDFASDRLHAGSHKFLPDYLKTDLNDIVTTRTLSEENVNELFCYLHDTTGCHEAVGYRGYYYNNLLDIIKNNKMEPLAAIDFIEKIEEEDDYMIDTISRYFEYQYDRDFLTIILYMKEDLKVLNENNGIQFSELKKLTDLERDDIVKSFNQNQLYELLDKRVVGVIFDDNRNLETIYLTVGGPNIYIDFQCDYTGIVFAKEFGMEIQSSEIPLEKWFEIRKIMQEFAINFNYCHTSPFEEVQNV